MPFPCNYIAFDEIEETERYKDNYNAQDLEAFNSYIENQLAKVDVPDITPEERSFMRRMMLTMYANPLRNQLAATECAD